MNPNINPSPYASPPPAPTHQKKKMTPAKWVAIFVPIGIIVLALTVFVTVYTGISVANTILKQVAKTEQYEVAFDYLLESDILTQIETEDTTITLTGYQSSILNHTAKYTFTFKTEKARYIIVVRDDGNGLYVSEDECQYRRYLAKASHLTYGFI